jgi:CheY-like chemotaxis protein
MPRVDGIAVIRRLRNAFPGARIVAITGGGRHGLLDYKPDTIVTDAYLELAKKTGADAVMTKPFDRSEIVDVVRSLVRN